MYLVIQGSRLLWSYHFFIFNMFPSELCLEAVIDEKIKNMEIHTGTFLWAGAEVVPFISTHISLATTQSHGCT